MNGKFELVWSAIFFACLCCVLDAEILETPRNQYVEGELLVSLTDDVSSDSWVHLQSELDLSVSRKLSHNGKTLLVKVGEKVDLAEVFRRLGADDLIEAVSYNFIRSISLTPDDPYLEWEALWGHYNAGHFSGVVGADIDSESGWDIANDAGNVVVAVLDTGVRYTHEDLAANMWVNEGEIPGNGIDDDGNDYVDDVHGINATDGSGDPMDDMGHGTHVAGILGAVGNNGVGVVGVAWNVQIMALKFLDEKGDGTDADAVECINYAIEQGVDIINNSWGGGGYNAVIEKAIDDANEKGILFVAAAGNSNSDTDKYPNYPSSYEFPNVVSVAATNRNDELADFSNFGESSVDIAAPGDEIYSTYAGSDSDYRTLNGSSMAAPFVSGVLAVMKSRFPDEAMAALVNRLYSSADPLPDLARRCRTGARLNFNNALQETLLPPLNDSFSNPILLSAASVQSASFNATASREVNEPIHNESESGQSVWWRWSAPNSDFVEISTEGSDFLSLFSVYRGESLAELKKIAESVSSMEVAAVASFDAEQGVDYYIAVDGLDGEAGNISLTLSQAVANDDFDSAKELVGLAISDEVNNGAATVEENEQSVLGHDPVRSLWWSWEAPVSGEIALSTSGSSNVDTILAIYQGESIDDLNLVSADLDSGLAYSSLVTFDATKGEKYYISVDSWQGEVGDVSISILAGQNDDFFEYRRLVGASLTDLAYNGFADKEVGEPKHADNVGGCSLWWRWEATRNGQAIVDTFGSDFDTLLAVYRGTNLLDLELVASNDDLGGSLTSQVTFDVRLGDHYYVAIDGRSGFSEAVTGKVQLNVDILEDPSTGLPIVDTSELAVATVNEAYSTILNLRNSGNLLSVKGLPNGLSFDSENRAIGGTPLESGVFEIRIEVENIEGVTDSVLMLRVEPSEGSPVLKLESDRKFVMVGDALDLSVPVSGAGEMAFQWFKDGELLEGQTDSFLSLGKVSISDAGNYQLIATNSLGTANSEEIEVFINHNTLANISTRGFARTGAEIMIAGFVITGDEPRRVLVRAVGPSLEAQGVSGFLQDPQFLIYSGDEIVGESDNWALEGAQAELESAFKDIGAFALSSNNDAAALVTLDPGIYTVLSFGADGGEGVVLTEVYDADRGLESGSRLVNVSTRVYASVDEKIAIAGFVIDGEQPKKVIVRALGPSLIDEEGAILTAETVLPDPLIMLYGPGGFIKANDDWSNEGAEEMELLFERVGASPLARGSFDAAMSLSLPPGPYSVLLWNFDESEGISLLEVYEVDE
ncbi:S8 family serine peptidase [Puniceicoccaceae bacterium K14]|nr:S8 family serine peptidase [Puniceicoccaceae bacterium K14]